MSHVTRFLCVLEREASDEEAAVSWKMSRGVLLIAIALATSCTGVGTPPEEAALTVPGGSSGGAADGMAAVDHYAVSAAYEERWRVDGLSWDESLVVSFVFARGESGAIEIAFDYPFSSSLLVGDDGTIVSSDGEIPSEQAYLVRAVETDMLAAAS